MTTYQEVLSVPPPVHLRRYKSQDAPLPDDCRLIFGFGETETLTVHQALSPKNGRCVGELYATEAVNKIPPKTSYQNINKYISAVCCVFTEEIDFYCDIWFNVCQRDEFDCIHHSLENISDEIEETVTYVALVFVSWIKVKAGLPISHSFGHEEKDFVDAYILAATEAINR